MLFLKEERSEVRLAVVHRISLSENTRFDWCIHGKRAGWGGSACAASDIQTYSSFPPIFWEGRGHRFINSLVKKLLREEQVDRKSLTVACLSVRLSGV